MHEQTPRLEDLSARLDPVERRYRRLRYSAIALALMLWSAGLVVGQLRPPEPAAEIGLQPRLFEGAGPEAIEPRVISREFMFVDRDGNHRASLVPDNAGSVFLTLLDAESNLRAAMSVTNRGPAVTFYDPDGQVRTVLGSTPLVGSHVEDRDGNLERDTPSSIVLFDSEGNPLWREPWRAGNEERKKGGSQRTRPRFRIF